MKIKDYNIYKYEILLKSPLLMKGALLNSRSGLILEMIDDNKISSFGEIAPFPNLHKETIEDAEKNLKGFFCEFIKQKIEISNSDILIDFLDDYTLLPSVRFGIETALFSSNAKSKKISLAEMFSSNPDNMIAINALIDIGNSNFLADIENSIKSGFKSIKIKVGDNIDNDMFRISAISNLISKYSNLTLRLDGNRKMNYSSAQELLRNIPNRQIEYIEEPLKDIALLEQLYHDTKVPIALDETIYETEKPKNIELFDGIAAFIIKPSAIGSYKKILELNDIAKNHSIKFIISSTFESSIGMSALCNLTAGLNLYPEAMGLDTFKWFENDLKFNESSFCGSEINLSKISSIDDINMDLLIKVLK